MVTLFLFENVIKVFLFKQIKIMKLLRLSIPSSLQFYFQDRTLQNGSLAAAYLFHKKEAASLITIAVLKLKRSTVTSVATASYTMLMKMSGLKLLLSLALVKPLEAMILKFMDKFQCSRRIALAYFTAGSIGSISVFSLMFFLLQRFVVY